MRNEYQNLMKTIHVPDRLNERVLCAACSQINGKRSATTDTDWIHPVFRMAVCACLALTLVLGGVELHPTLEAGEAKMSYDFGLITYASDGEMTETAANGGIAFGTAGNGTIHAQTLTAPAQKWLAGRFTDFAFRIQGEGIESVSVAISRGGLYRKEAGGEPVAQPEGILEVYDPSVTYGFWIPPTFAAQDCSLSAFEGAELSVSAVFVDGTERTERYCLSLERLETVENEDGSRLLVPILSGDERTAAIRLYAEPLDGTWFCWPVEGAHTISLSHRYGYRWNSGRETRIFHPGIDIPGERGLSVTAAATGTVIETGFDTKRGNYLILDHGGGTSTLYGQCQELLAEKGDTVTAGDEIALLGATGEATGPHLHFEVRQDGEAQNPIAYFSANIRDTLRMG